MAQAASNKIGVLIEAHFDETEFHRFNEVFPANGYEVEYISHLWGQPSLTFKGNDFTTDVVVTVEVNDIDPKDYAGIILIGGYAMDRLRYQENPKKDVPNTAPSVNFLRKALATPGLKIGTICHSLWLFCADPALMKGRKVTCAHNIMYDVINAGGIYIYDGDQGKDTVVDGNLISGRHPGVVEEFMDVYLKELKKG